METAIIILAALAFIGVIWLMMDLYGADLAGSSWSGVRKRNDRGLMTELKLSRCRAVPRD